MVFKLIVLDGLGFYVEVFFFNGVICCYFFIKEFFYVEINFGMEFIFSGEGIFFY